MATICKRYWNARILRTPANDSKKQLATDAANQRVNYKQDDLQIHATYTEKMSMNDSEASSPLA